MIDGHRQLYVYLGHVVSSWMLCDTGSSMVAIVMLLCAYMDESKFVYGNCGPMCYDEPMYRGYQFNLIFY